MIVIFDLDGTLIDIAEVPDAVVVVYPPAGSGAASLRAVEDALIRRAVDEARGNVAQAARQGRPFAYGVIDIDKFKEVNDTHGHPVGDEVLRQVAEAVTENVRPSDFVFRYGGEDYAVHDLGRLLGGAGARRERRLGRE